VFPGFSGRAERTQIQRSIMLIMTSYLQTPRLSRSFDVRAPKLDRSHPGAAASLREGLEETLTVTRLGVKGKLKKTLESTNPCESMIECVRRSITERQALAERRDVHALDRRRDARSRATVPTRDRPRRPRQARHRRRARTNPSPAQPRSDRGGRYARQRVTINPDRHRSSTPSGTSSAKFRRAPRAR
jgi:hypothetical protein